MKNTYERTEWAGRMHPGGNRLTREQLATSKLTAGRVLDIGCGDGGSVALLDQLGFTVAGVDISPALLTVARQKSPRAQLVCADAHALPFEVRCFDAVLCECVLSLLDNPSGALLEAWRVLRDGGLLLWSDLYAGEERTDCPMHTMDAWAYLFRQSGFKLRAMQDAGVYWREFVADILWNAADPGAFSSCLPQGVRLADIGYCWGIAEKIDHWQLTIARG